MNELTHQSFKNRLFSVWENKHCYVLVRQARKFEDMQRAFNEVLSRGLKPDARMYNSMMSCYAKALRKEDAMKVFRDMKNRGCAPITHTFNILISMYAIEARSREAEAIFRQVLTI